MPQRTTAALLFAELAGLETDDHVLWPGMLDRDGYGRVRYEGPKWGTHRLALHLRVEKPAGCTMVCHRPGLGCPKRCMNYRHLYWGTAATNNVDTATEGHSTKGERQPRHILTVDDVREIRRLSETLTCRQIADRFDVSPQVVRSAAIGKNWGWLE